MASLVTLEGEYISELEIAARAIDYLCSRKNNNQQITFFTKSLQNEPYIVIDAVNALTSKETISCP